MATRRQQFTQATSSMPSDVYADKDDEDDYGMPLYRPNNSSSGSFYSPRRLKKWSPLLGLLLICLLWFSWPRSLTRTNWKKYAYVQYATDEHNLCNAVMVFEALHRHGSKAQRVLLHNPQWASVAQGGDDRSAQLLSIAEKKYGVTLKPVRLLDERGETTPGAISGGGSTWDTSITKLRAFELTEYERVLHLDSDISLFDNLDGLFLLPSTPVAMPRAYWSDTPAGSWPLTSLMVLLEPNPAELRGMLATLRSWWIESEQTKSGLRQYDMELLNHRFGASAMVLPHRDYALLSAEFRRKHHEAYLGTINSPTELKHEWDAERVLKEAKLVHFSDWPLPKPWIMWPYEGLAEVQPNCTALHERLQCKEREVWKGLYDDFRRRRKDICKLLSVAAPDWRRQKAAVGAA